MNIFLQINALWKIFLFKNFHLTELQNRLYINRILKLAWKRFNSVNTDSISHIYIIKWHRSFAFRSIPKKKNNNKSLNTWHVTKKETNRSEKRGGCTSDTMRIVSCQRLRVSSVLCNAGTEAKHRRDSATVRGIESSSTIYRFMHTIYGGARAGNVFRGRVTFIRDAFGTPAGPFILQKLLFVPLFAFFPRPELLSSRVSRVFFCLQRDMHPLIEVIPCLAIKFNGVCFRANLDRTDLSQLISGVLVSSIIELKFFYKHERH